MTLTVNGLPAEPGCYVEGSAGSPRRPKMSDYIDEMVDAYVEALLWAGLAIGDENDTDENTPTFEEAGYSAWDLTPEALSEVLRDCQDFYETHACILDWVRTRGLMSQWYSPGQAGHDFYLTRNGHGAGFWDRGLGVLGDILTAGSKPYGETNEYAENGKVYAG